VGPIAAADGPRQSAPYNLLVTRDWLLVVPRSREHAGGVSINALGYAGSLFVRDGAELARLREMGPMRALAAVSVPR
jgi:ATP adenylyltransferase